MPPNRGCGGEALRVAGACVCVSAGGEYVFARIGSRVGVFGGGFTARAGSGEAGCATETPSIRGSEEAREIVV